jgi:protocatechuate 3,4-dioxygenase beta subunit
MTDLETLPLLHFISAAPACPIGKCYNKTMKKLLCIFSVTVFLLVIGGSFVAAMGAEDQAMQCEPTREDHLGPFYEPNAPLRSTVGQGYVLSGKVRSATDCSPLAEARIEFWLAGPSGRYADDYRATVLTDEAGAYRFESNFPPGYRGRPPHIHVRVSAPGFRTLITQHYPEKGRTEASFELVLVPVR